MTDARKVELLRQRLSLVRRGTPELAPLIRVIGKFGLAERREEMLLEAVEKTLTRSDTETLEWVLRELFEVTP